MSYVYAIVSKDGSEFEHRFTTPNRGFQDFSVLPHLVRRAHGRDAVVVRIGIRGSAVSKGWEPPPGPLYTVKLAKNKFAFGRKFVPKDNDFDSSPG